MQTQTVVVTISQQQMNAMATGFIRKANSFKSQIKVTLGGNSVNAKSLLGFLSLQPPTGSEVTLTADGSDEAEALAALAAMLS